MFTELENTLNSFDNYILTKEDLIEKIANEVTLSTCVECAYYKQCLQKNKPNKDDLIKLINIGCNKGKVTLIDLSRDFSEYCYSATTMLTQINKLLEVYSEKTKELISVSSSKNLIQLQSHAVSEVLKQLAFEFSHKVDFNSEKEGIIFESLSTVGIVPKQILFIEDSYHLIFDKQNLLFSSIAKILSTALNENLSLTSRKDIGNKTLVTFTSAPCLDACFGIATKIKDGSAYSGDSHLLTKIDNEKFIVSLCDGMGSGENAKNNSNLAISLFENLYKIGLNEDMAVDLANKLLSVCSSENFSTLDCAIFDLHKKCASLIKLGASYGFFITQDEVRILENSSLPLGILDEISPNYYHLEVNSGDMLVMISDGISDAFFSSTDTVDFLLSNKTKNPQTLANKLLSRAIEQYGGIAKDDMTVIVIKLF